MMKKLLAALFGAALALPAAAQTVRGVTDTEIVIGTYTDLSGVTAMWGVNNNNAWRMVFDETNAAGGIHGRKIKYITEDNQYTVPRSVQAANKLINRDNVFIMVGNGGTPMNNATMPDQLAKGVPNVFPLTSARSMYHPLHPLKFGFGASYYDQMRSGIKEFVEKRGKKAICAISQDTDFGRDVMDGVRDQLKAMNLPLVAETLHKPTETDFGAYVARLIDAKCDLVILGTIVRDTIQIISSAKKAGWNVEFLGQAAIYDEAVAEAPGGLTEGVYAMVPVLRLYPDDPRPAVREFADKFKKLYGKEPNFAAQIGYTAAQLVVEALKASGKTLTADSFVAGMESINGWQDKFGSPVMSFSKTKHQGSDSSYLCVVKGGRWVPVSGTPYGY